MNHWLKTALAAAVALATVLGCTSTTTKEVPIFRQVAREGTEQDTTPGPSLYVSLGQLHIGAGRDTEAVEAFRRAVAMDARHGKAQGLLGVSLDRLGRHTEALKCHRKAVKLMPKDAPAWNNLGYCQLRLKQWFDATDAFQKAIDLDPDNARYQNNAAVALAMGGLPKESLERFKRAVGSAQAHYNLGCMFYYQNLLGRAREQFTEALKLDPKMKEARAWIRQIDGQPAEPAPATMPTAMIEGSNQ